jgi:hypothetical protein
MPKTNDKTKRKAKEEKAKHLQSMAARKTMMDQKEAEASAGNSPVSHAQANTAESALAPSSPAALQAE